MTKEFHANAQLDSKRQSESHWEARSAGDHLFVSFAPQQAWLELCL